MSIFKSMFKILNDIYVCKKINKMRVVPQEWIQEKQPPQHTHKHTQ